MGLGVAAKSLIKGASALGSKKIGGVSMAAAGFELAQSTWSVKSDVEQGHSMKSSVGRELFNSALFMYNAPLAMAVTTAPMIYQGAKMAHQFRRQKHDNIISGMEHAAGNTVGGNYLDTNQAATMRQAAVQQIQGNKLNARSSLGGEARIFSGYNGYR